MHLRCRWDGDGDDDDDNESTKVGPPSSSLRVSALVQVSLASLAKVNKPGTRM